jgi:hypothetical protein
MKKIACWCLCFGLVSGCAWLQANAPQLIGTLTTVGKICLECHTVKAPDAIEISLKSQPVVMQPGPKCPEHKNLVSK